MSPYIRRLTLLLDYFTLLRKKNNKLLIQNFVFLNCYTPCIILIIFFIVMNTQFSPLLIKVNFLLEKISTFLRHPSVCFKTDGKRFRAKKRLT